MIDISEKKITKRIAVAEGKIFLSERIIKRIKENKIEKGDVLKTAETSAILAMKQTPFIIPHCHPVKITKGEVSFSYGKNYIKVISTVEGFDRTGFEMEALMSVSVALLTIYDMCKKYQKDMEIDEIILIEKRGGKSILKRKK